MLTAYASPRRFMTLSGQLLPWLAVACVLVFAYGLYLALVGSPADYQQEETVRIMYLHVPAAWWAMGIYGGIGLSSAVFLANRHSLADLIARKSAPVGALFAFICLMTGSLWGRPMWGAYWVWDARLTSMLIMFFIYLGYMALAAQSANDLTKQKICAIIALVGLVNLPIIKFSVDWWNTLHQPASVFKMSGPAIDGSMLLPLGVMSGAFFLFYLVMLLMAVRTELMEAKIRRQRFKRETV